MKRLILLAPWIAVLAGCARAPDQLQPGRWEFELVITSLEAPGLPAETQQMMQASLNRPQTNRDCLTSDAAANPLRELREQVTRGQEGMTCQTSEDVFSRGVIRFGANCQAVNGGRSQLTLEGRFNAITLQADISGNAEVPNPNGAGSQTVRTRGMIRGRRTGDCAPR